MAEVVRCRLAIAQADRMTSRMFDTVNQWRVGTAGCHPSIAEWLSRSDQVAIDDRLAGERVVGLV